MVLCRIGIEEVKSETLESESPVVVGTKKERDHKVNSLKITLRTRSQLKPSQPRRRPKPVYIFYVKVLVLESESREPEAEVD